MVQLWYMHEEYTCTDIVEDDWVLLPLHPGRLRSASIDNRIYRREFRHSGVFLTVVKMQMQD